MQPLQLVLIEPAALRRVGLDALGKPVVELLVVIEKRRHNEVEKRPQLGHAVLYWRTR